MDHEPPFYSIFTASLVVHITSYTSSALLFTRLPQLPRYTYPCLHYSPTGLLQLTLCWSPSWAVAVARPGLALCCMPLCMHPHIYPCLQLYAGCALLAPTST